MTQSAEIAQLLAKREELLEMQAALNKEINYSNAMQTALKLVLNGSYGAFANPFFCMSNKDIAGAITAMGRELIQYMDRCNEEYWYSMWHLDVPLHEALDIDTKTVQPIDQRYYNRVTTELQDTASEDELNPDILEDGKGPACQRKAPVSIYADTDSLFVGFAAGMASCSWSGDPHEFVRRVNSERLQAYFTNRLEEYAANYGVKNVQDFELERVNYSTIFLQKKRYVQHVAWEDKASFDELAYLAPKGVELVKSSTPPFAREKAKEIIQYLFRNPSTYNIKDLLKLVRDIKRQFELADIEDISMTTSCNNYHKHVLCDGDRFEMAVGAPAGVKAAALHNHLLHLNPAQRGKYDTIKSGTRIKTYYCVNPLNDVFGYMRGQHPIEFAPEVDMDKQFEKVILMQVNTFVKALGLPELNKRLRVVLPLF